MFLTLKIDTANQADIESAIRALTAFGGTPVTEIAKPTFGEVFGKAPETEKPKRGRPRKADIPTAEDLTPVPDPEPTPEPEDDRPMALIDDEPAAEAEGMTLAELQSIAKDVVTSGPDGRDRLKAVLAEVGATRLSELAPEQFATVAEGLRK